MAKIKMIHLDFINNTWPKNNSVQSLIFKSTIRKQFWNESMVVRIKIRPKSLTNEKNENIKAKIIFHTIHSELNEITRWHSPKKKIKLFVDDFFFNFSGHDSSSDPCPTIATVKTGCTGGTKRLKERSKK